MSNNCKYYKLFYDMKIATKQDLKKLVKYGVLTESEFKFITGEDYTE